MFFFTDATPLPLLLIVQDWANKRHYELIISTTCNVATLFMSNLVCNIAYCNSLSISFVDSKTPLNNKLYIYI